MANLDDEIFQQDQKKVIDQGNGKKPEIMGVENGSFF